MRRVRGISIWNVATLGRPALLGAVHGKELLKGGRELGRRLCAASLLWPAGFRTSGSGLELLEGGRPWVRSKVCGSEPQLLSARQGSKCGREVTIVIGDAEFGKRTGASGIGRGVTVSGGELSTDDGREGSDDDGGLHLA